MRGQRAGDKPIEADLLFLCEGDVVETLSASAFFN
jgi:hypothetical protein